MNFLLLKNMVGRYKYYKFNEVRADGRFMVTDSASWHYCRVLAESITNPEIDTNR